MANAKKCDRCGRLYECYEGVPMVPQGNKYYGIALTGNERARGYDLCPPCMARLRAWLGYDDTKPDEIEQDCENIKEG